MPQLYGAKISPDGHHVAWIWAGRWRTTTQLWVTAADRTEAPACVLVAERLGLRFPFAGRRTAAAWSMLGQPRDGDERVGLHQVFLDGRPSVALTEDRPDYYIHGGQAGEGWAAACCSIGQLSIGERCGDRAEPGLSCRIGPKGDAPRAGAAEACRITAGLCFRPTTACPL